MPQCITCIDLSIDKPKRAYYNYPTLKPMYCASHKLDSDMRDLVSLNCLTPECYNRRQYNLPDLKPMYCKGCATTEMVDLANNKCIICKKTRASFNLPDLKPKYCKLCSTDAMQDVTYHKWCLECLPIKTRANFNLPTESIPVACSKHIKENFVDIINKKCEFGGCQKNPSQNLPGEKKRLFCAEHALSCMQDVVNQKCQAENCDKIPSYNILGETKRLFCAEHSLDDMQNIVSNRCEEINCHTIATYNYSTEKTRRFCSNHALENMVDINSNMCIKCNITRANYNSPTLKAKYCNKCKDPQTMIDVVHTNCTSCGVFRAEKKNNFLCSYCNPEKSKIRLSKENIIKKLLESELPEHSFIHNKQFSNECCFKYRPDFLFDCGTYFIVLEVDEYAHSGYSLECEIVRMNAISLGLGLPTKFIRYNPDESQTELKNPPAKIKREKLIDILKENLSQSELLSLEPIYLFY
jgi:hypothetical protein